MTDEQMAAVKTVAVLGARVLVQRDERPVDPRTPGGILIPGQAARAPMTGTVLVVGTEAEGQYGATVGARVVLAPYAGIEMRVADVPLAMVEVRDLLAVVGTIPVTA